MASLVAIGLKLMGFGKGIFSWLAGRSWKFWAGVGIAFSIVSITLAFNNLHNENQELLLERQKQEQRIDAALDKNEELQGIIKRMETGQKIDSQIVVSNQAEIDRMRKEHEERQREIAAQGSSGPAGRATICAITGVCQ